MTAPTENGFEVGVEAGTVKMAKPDAGKRGTHPVTVTSDTAVERVVSLLNEVVAQGALPAL